MIIVRDDWLLDVVTLRFLPTNIWSLQIRLIQRLSIRHKELADALLHSLSELVRNRVALGRG